MPKPRCVYCKYFFVGTVVGLTAIAARELIGLLLPADNQGYYILSVLIVYVVGILASFYGHYRVTFSHIEKKQKMVTAVQQFTAIAIVGMLITVLLSYIIRYGVRLEFIPDRYAAAVAFGTATICASLVSYVLNSRYTFADTERHVALRGES